MSVALRRQVVERANHRCEFCRIPQQCVSILHHVDHIRPRKHRGKLTLSNTCLACAACNGAKGANLTGIDPITLLITRLFNPRRDEWQNHFRWSGSKLVGLTRVGRTTIEVLNINLPNRVEQRAYLMKVNRYYS
jgi:hypothetical protein